MKTRTDLLNNLAEKYQLKRYLEIGVQNPMQNFDKINCEFKISVDPDPNAHASFPMTSDDFFRIVIEDQWMGGGRYDLIFIDGLHTSEQVKKDFENALKVVTPNGFIVLHDCNPEKEEHTIVPRPTERGHWNGDVYKFAATIQQPKFTVDIDNGCMVIYGEHHFIKECKPTFQLIPDTGIDWTTFAANRPGLLNLISWDEFISIGSHV